MGVFAVHPDVHCCAKNSTLHRVQKEGIEFVPCAALIKVRVGGRSVRLKGCNVCCVPCSVRFDVYVVLLKVYGVRCTVYSVV